MLYNRRPIKLENLVLILILLLSIIVGTYQINDSDFWWHLKTGEYIIRNNTIPHYDVFSWVGISSKLPWIAHEWLTDVIFYMLYQLWGFYGLIFIANLMFLIFVALTFYEYKKYFITHPLISIPWAIMFVVNINGFFKLRPQIFTFILLTMFYKFLLRYINNDKLHNIKLTYKSSIYFAIAALLIANLHGGVLITFISVFLAIIAANSFNLAAGKLESHKLIMEKRKQLLLWMSVFIICALVNPYGIKALTYSFEMLKNPVLMDYIIEWKSPDFHLSEAFILYLCLVFIISIFICTIKKIRLQDFLLFGIYSYATLKHQRIQAIFLILMTPAVFYHIDGIKLDFDLGMSRKANAVLRSIKTFATEKRIRTALSIAAALLTMLSVFSITAPDDVIDLSDYPAGAMQKLREYKPERMFNLYNFGGYLIWELHDDGIYPFYDGRADVFVPIFKEGVSIDMGLAGCYEVIEKYNFDALLLHKNNILEKYLLETGKWEKIYEDGLCYVLYKSQ